MPLGSVSYEQEANAKGERLIWLAGIRGVGQQTAGILETEVFYRKFQNRREVASYVGMTPTTDRFSTSATLSLKLLSAAAQRDDLCLTAMPNLSGGAARKVGEKLIAAGLVKEILAKARAPVWRCDDANAQSYALKLTTAGLKAIAVDPDGRQEGAAELKTPNGVNRSNADPRTPRKGQGRRTEAAQGRDGEGVQVHPRPCGRIFEG